MENPNQQNQTRFFIAAALCMAVLFGWQYFFAPPPKPATDANTQVANTAAATPTPQVEATPVPQVAANVPDNTPNRTITIKSPLYEVTLDSKGAVATSWILLKNKSSHGEYPVFADGSNETEKKPLQLISDEARKRNPRELPFRLTTEDQNVNALLNDRNYQISAPEETIALADGQEKQIDFTLTDPSGVAVTKTFVFRADSYVSDLSVKLTNNGQAVPNTKVLIGASIGDHGINNHNFYHIESETVASISGDIKRHQGYYSFEYKNGAKDASLADNGNIEWAGVADAYFAQLAIPVNQTQGQIDYRSSKYDVETRPYFDGIYSWITRSEKTSETRHLVSAYVPVSSEGAATKIYTGTKDYFTLNEYNTALAKEVNRDNLYIVDSINFSNYSLVRWFVRPLSIPILYSLTFINGFTHNYGVAIILFTFLFYSLLFPLRWSQSKSFKKAAGNAPKLQAIQEKQKELQKKGVPMDDPRMRELQMEQLKMMKTAVPIGGCLPMLLQFPLLIAFYTAVTISLAIRQATFLWLPDLSAGDPYHILEFAFAISMVLSMKFTPTTPVTTPEQQMQQKMMTYIMPVMMLWVMWSAPAGLLLYWFFGNIVSFGQQMIINKMNKTGEPPQTEIVDSVPTDAKKVKTSLSTS